jgi:hypothetical protein
MTIQDVPMQQFKLADSASRERCRRADDALAKAQEELARCEAEVAMAKMEREIVGPESQRRADAFFARLKAEAEANVPA